MSATAAPTSLGTSSPTLPSAELVTERDRIASEIGLRPKSGEVYRRAPESAGAIPEYFERLLTAIRDMN